MSADAPLAALEILSQDGIVWAASRETLGDRLDHDITIRLNELSRPSYFYLRARQVDGGLVYASPVWIDVE